MSLPAGLVDNRIEFFTDPVNKDQCDALTNGTVYRVRDLPADIKELIWADIFAHPKKLKALTEMGYIHSDELLEKYCSCCFGAFDGDPDFTAGVFAHSEYVPCVVRDSCPADGVLCNPLTVGNGHVLTNRQASILMLAGKCLLNKEIADRLSISQETVKIHIKNIQRKAGVMNKKDLVLIAHQKNLI